MNVKVKNNRIFDRTAVIWRSTQILAVKFCRCISFETASNNEVVIKMIVFDKLWETMKNKGISTYVLVEKHNIDTRTIRRLKTDKNTTTDTLNKLCDILNCNSEDIATHI